MSDVNDRAVLSGIKADRQGALDFIGFNRLPHVSRMKYEDGFAPPDDHNEWVERQISKGKGKKPLFGDPVRTTVREAIEEVTEERAFFERNKDKVLTISKRDKE
jgi:hypothetical protein